MGGGGGGLGKCTILANVPGIEHILAIKVLMPSGEGGGGSRQMHYSANVPGIEHILAIKVLMPMGVGGVMSPNTPPQKSPHIQI